MITEIELYQHTIKAGEYGGTKVPQMKIVSDYMDPRDLETEIVLAYSKTINADPRNGVFIRDGLNHLYLKRPREPWTDFSLDHLATETSQIVLGGINEKAEQYLRGMVNYFQEMFPNAVVIDNLS